MKLTKIGLFCVIALSSLSGEVELTDEIDPIDFIGPIAIGEEPIQLDLNSISNKKVTMSFASDEGKAYTITWSPDLSSGSWNTDGTTARFNGIAVNGEGSDRYVYIATSALTTVEITFTEEAPVAAFCKAAEFIVTGI